MDIAWTEERAARYNKLLTGHSVRPLLIAVLSRHLAGDDAELGAIIEEESARAGVRGRPLDHILRHGLAQVAFAVGEGLAQSELSVDEAQGVLEVAIAMSSPGSYARYRATSALVAGFAQATHDGDIAVLDSFTETLKGSMAGAGLSSLAGYVAWHNVSAHSATAWLDTHGDAVGGTIGHGVGWATRADWISLRSLLNRVDTVPAAVLQSLVDVALTDEHFERRYAAETLHNISGWEPLALTRLQDNDAKARQRVAQLMARAPRPSFAPPLRRILDDVQDQETAAACMDALAAATIAAGSVLSQEELESLINKTDSVGGQAVSDIADYCRQEFPRLHWGMSGEPVSDGVQRWIVTMLGYTMEPSLSPAVRTALQLMTPDSATSFCETVTWAYVADPTAFPDEGGLETFDDEPSAVGLMALATMLASPRVVAGMVSQMKLMSDATPCAAVFFAEVLGHKADLLSWAALLEVKYCALNEESRSAAVGLLAESAHSDGVTHDEVLLNHIPFDGFPSEHRELSKHCEAALVRVLTSAMGAEREWPADDWLRHLASPPAWSDLLARTVWQELRLDGSVASFRPVGGTFVDAAGNRVDAPVGPVSLAYVTNMPAEERTAWQQHFADHSIDWLLPQFDHAEPSPEALAGNTFDHRSECPIDPHALVAVGAERGFAPYAVWDTMIEYWHRPIPGTRFSLLVGTSYVYGKHPEEIPVHLTSLKVILDGEHHVNVPFSDVPRALLTQAYADYEEIANRCGTH